MYANIDYKHKSRSLFSVDSDSRESLFSGYENNREHRSDHVRNRDRSTGDRDYRDKDRSLYRRRDSSNSRDGYDKVVREEQSSTQPIQQSFSNYNANDHSFIDSNKRMLSMMPSYNLVTQLNVPWNINSMDGMTMSQHNLPVPVNQNSTMSMSPGLEVVQTPNSSMNTPTFMSGMYAGASLGKNSHYGIVPPQENIGPVKEIIKLKKSILYPPNPNEKRSTIDKPRGCKTIFVNGLPEKATEEIIREIFERCGCIDRITMSKKNFCHVRFSDEQFVENAMYLSGYRLNVDYKDETLFSSVLHVDYSPSRDDQYDYKCKQRALERQARHQEQDYSKSKKSPTEHYSENEASLVCEKLKNEETFSEAANILITWLEKGECTKKTSGNFFSMIQSTHTHVRKLEVEKVKYEEQLNDAKKMLKKQLEGIIRQFTEVCKIYKAASLQKCWDHFTKAQRKYIEMWKKQTEELKNTHVEEVINEREDEEMELSDDENEVSKKENEIEQVKQQYEERIEKLQEVNDSLKCKLESAQNEIMVMQSNHQVELEQNNKQLVAVQTALQHSIQEKLNQNQKISNDELKLKEVKCKVQVKQDENNDLSCDSSDTSGNLSAIIENDARLIGLISAFLNIHHLGASIDYICAYLRESDCSVKIRDVENLMNRFPTLFKEESSGVGASLQKKWRFIRIQTVDRSTMCDFSQ